jgi:hypothetical protein
MRRIALLSFVVATLLSTPAFADSWLYACTAPKECGKDLQASGTTYVFNPPRGGFKGITITCYTRMDKDRYAITSFTQEKAFLAWASPTLFSLTPGTLSGTNGIGCAQALPDSGHH